MLSRYSEYDKRYGFTTLRSGAFHDCALHKDGFVLCTGSNSFGQCNTDAWTGIQAIACGDYHTVGFNGRRVLSTGSNKSGQCNIPKKRGVKQITCGSNHTVILYKNGYLRAVGNNNRGQCDVIGLKHIKRIFAINDLTIAIDEAGNAYLRGDIPIYFQDRSIIKNVEDIFMCENYAVIKLTSHIFEATGDVPGEFIKYLGNKEDTDGIKKIICAPCSLLAIWDCGISRLFTTNARLEFNTTHSIKDAILLEPNKNEIHIHSVNEDGIIQSIKVRHSEERLWIE